MSSNNRIDLPRCSRSKLVREPILGTAARIINAVRMFGFVIRIRNFPAPGPDQKLFPHFSQSSTAIFSVKQFEYGRHDQTSLFDYLCIEIGRAQVRWITFYPW